LLANFAGMHARVFGILGGLLSTLWSQAQWTFKGDSTATWEQAIARYQKLDRMHTGARLLEIGNDDDGSPIHVFLISDGSGFTPDSIRAAGKNILWITNGIHPGEPDGVDASLLLAQALLESDQLMGLVVHTAVCIVPVYNVWGAKQREHPSRPDQQGPSEHGIRANARNLDLNRDFVKMDARNTWTLADALRTMDPDVYFETHVSDGADHRYVMELLTTQKDKLSPSLSAFMTATMIPELYTWMDRKGMLMCPYFETVQEVPDSGLVAFYDSPRYSTGYNALFDRIGILSESHMLKPYAQRVNATFQLMLATLAVMNKYPGQLHEAREEAKARTAAVDTFGFNWTLDTTRVDSLEWKGYPAGQEASRVTGLPRLEYDSRKTLDITVPWMESYRASLMKRKPKAYHLPAAWARDLVPRMELSGVQLVRITNDTVLTVEVSTITDFNTSHSPFEGHYLHSDVRATRERTKITAHQGDFIISMGAATDRYVMEVLECDAEDSFFAWGFFDSILQQKEWFTPYSFEDIAAFMLEQEPDLQKQLEVRRAGDPAFASDRWAQLNFVLQHSAYRERNYRRYPVLRVVE